MKGIDKLTQLAVKNAKPKSVPYKLSDGASLYLLVTTTGCKSWRYDYRFNGKRKTATFGLYPTISLKDARQARQEFAAKLAQGIDPLEEQKDIDEQAQLKTPFMYVNTSSETRFLWN